MLHKVITLANFKGGVGKSTSTAAIGACLAMKGYKVLLVDLDGQSNLTLYYVPNADIMEDSNLILWSLVKRFQSLTSSRTLTLFHHPWKCPVLRLQ